MTPENRQPPLKTGCRGSESIGEFDQQGHLGLCLRARKYRLAMKSPPKSAISFETALLELENVVQSLENGGLPLEASLRSYERGVQLLKHCQDMLGQAEQKIHLLEGNSLQPIQLGTTGGGDA